MSSISQSRRPRKFVADSHPHLIDEWSPNNSKTPYQVTHGSAYLAQWICRAHLHVWETRVHCRTIQRSGCPFCSNSRVLKGYNDLATIYPEVAALWDHERNPNTPDSVTYRTPAKAHWICASNSAHRWSSPVYSRVKGVGCSVCAGLTVIEGVNDLSTTHPDLVPEWHEKNPIRPTSVTYGSDKSVWWRCHLDPTHEWKTKVVTRSVAGTNCPRCCIGTATSKIEDALSGLLSETELSVLDIPSITVNSSEWGKRFMLIDIIAQTPDKRKVAVEYDGEYWHRGTSDKDIRKTSILLEMGYIVFRVREAPLSHLELDHPNLHQLTFNPVKGKTAQDVSSTVTDILSCL